jgi:hypothetical protein
MPPRPQPSQLSASAVFNSTADQNFFIIIFFPTGSSSSHLHLIKGSSAHFFYYCSHHGFISSGKALPRSASTID